MDRQSIDKSSYTLTWTTTQISSKLCGPKTTLFSSDGNNSVANISSCFLLFCAPLLLHTRPPPSHTLLLLPQRWVSMNGEAVHSSSPAIKSPSPSRFVFEVELLYNWARRVCRLRRLLHLKFGRAVMPAETWRRPGGSRLKGPSDARIKKDEVLLSI